MRGLIVDSGLRGLSGHNLGYTSSVCAALEEEGCSVEVLANKNLPAALATKAWQRVFSLGAFDFAPQRSRPLRSLLYLYAQSVIHSQELSVAREALAYEPDFFFCHTIADFELISWNRSLSMRPMRSSLMILLRHTERFAELSRLKLWIHPFWRIRPHYLSTIHRKLQGGFTLLTDSELLSGDYRSIFPHRVVTLPIPVNPSLAARPRAQVRDRNELRVGYLGDARESKGFDLLSSALGRFLDRGSRDRARRARFLIQTSVDGGGPVPLSVTELLRLQQRFPKQLSILPDQLSQDEYLDVLAGLDVILLPYLDSKYNESTSGIFAEALTVGTPVVVSDGTWMARELRRSGGGVEFRRGDADHLAEQLEMVVRDHPAYLARAQAFAPEWSAFHNPTQVARHILAEAQRGRREGLPHLALVGA